MYWHFIRRQQGLMSGGHYNKEFACYDVDKMYHTDKKGTKHEGEHYSIECARKTMREHGISAPVNEYDVYVAMNAFWHDLSCVITDEEELIEATVAFWFKDEDRNGKDKIWEYFCRINN